MAIKEVIVDKDEKVNQNPASASFLTHPLLPPLQSGDRLTRREFERRYEAMPGLKKAELIEGMVFMPSPVSVDHSEPHAFIVGWLASYSAATPGVKPGDNATVRLDIDNEVQPDALLRLEIELGGTCRIGADRYLEGAPELVIEIAVSSAAYDLHDKLKVYRRNGVREYIVWQIYDKRLVWFRLNDEGDYLPQEPDEAGVIRSQVFSGLYLNVTALLKGDLAAVLGELQRGLETDEHQQFVERLVKKTGEAN